MIKEFLKFILTFLLFITPLYGQIEISKENHATIDICKSKEARKHKDKKKDKKAPEKIPVEQLTFPEALQKLFDLSWERFKQAEEKQFSVVRTFTNVGEVASSLHAAADLYDAASQIVKENLKITHFFVEKRILEKQIYALAFEFEGRAKKCHQEAAEWPAKVFEKKLIATKELERLRIESSILEQQEERYGCHEAYKQMALILNTLVENGEPDHGELAACQKKLIELETSTHLYSSDQPTISIDEFQETESNYRDYFFHAEKAEDQVLYDAIPLDGQGASLYLQQSYRYLIQRDKPAEHLCIKVFENGQEIYEQLIDIPIAGPSWEHYILNEMLLVPETNLNSLFGLDLQLSLVLDPYYNFSLVVSQKGSAAKYDFSFFLDDQPLYDIHFIPQPPWQLEALRKPKPFPVRSPTLPNSSINTIMTAGSDALHSIEEIPQPYLDSFIKELNRDPLALAQYVHNEIEMVDPFLVKDAKGVFQAPSIHRSPQRTFLEKKGSPWEQCMLLVYLLKHAGYETRYIEGLCSLPASFAEQLLFMQFPGEEEVLFNYPGIMFSDGKKWYPLFPWIKEIHTIEGRDLYSLMPEKYANAEKWVKQYLCCDENILKHVGPDGNDTVGVLFTRHLEECLRSQGLSLHDVGTHRTIQKKQFNSWDDFPRPVMKGEVKSSLNLPNRIEIFAKIKIKIYSEQNPAKKIETGSLNLSAFSLGAFAIYFTPHGPSEQLLHFCFSERWNDQHALLLDGTDKSISIDIGYETLMGPKDGYHLKKQFSLKKGTCAALCLHSGGANDKITSLFAEKFIKTESLQEKLNSLFAFIGAAYFEKCSRSEQILAALHKVALSTHFCVGLSKLSPDDSSAASLRFPQVDMCNFHFTQNHNKHPFSAYQEPHLSARYYHTLTNADASSNEHQVLREIYQDPYAISTVKLLQIAHQNHKKKGLPGSGFLIFTNQSFANADATPELARLLHFSAFPYVNLQQIKSIATSQWETLRSLFKENNSHYTFAYMTPGPVSSLDGYGLKPPSYTGIGTLIHSTLVRGALISDGVNVMNGGYGSALSNTFVQTITHKDWQLASNGNTYSFLPTKYAPLFSGKNPSAPTDNRDLPIFKAPNESNQSLTWWNNTVWALPIINQWKADVRKDHKSVLSTIADPVDIVSGAFYVDELDLNLPGAFPLEIRRNYSSQNLLPGLFGFGWKLSLNPVLHEEGDRLFAAEKDGTIIVYRYEQIQNRWIVRPEDNPELNNFGSTANPFHAYIEKNQGYILHGVDGSKRVFQDKLLKTWSDHANNTLTFSYENENLKRIESSSGGFFTFDYNYGGKISEIYAKDGRRVKYTYDSQGNLASVTLPNNASTQYEYDRFHRIVRETKPHGRVLENIYKEDKIAEQRSPVGPYQQMTTSATFTYTDGLTVVIDPAGGSSEYKIYKNKICKISDPEGHQVLQSWFLDSHTYFDAETEMIQQWDSPGAYQGSLKSSKDKRGLTTNYLYDEKGNVKEVSIIGEDLTGNGDTKASKYCLYDSHNLCIQEQTLNTKTITSYDSVNPYLIRRIEKYVDDVLISFLDLEYTSHGLVSKKNHSGAITLFEYDSRDFLTKQIQLTGTDDPDVITRLLYNDQGQCVDLITADAIQHNEYDIVGNQYCCTISLNSGEVLSKTYAGYDLNNALIWKQGDDPHDMLFLDYNAAGLLKASRRSLSQIKDSSIQSAGIAYSLYEYDACGRLIEQVDPLGNCTYSKYDALGRIVESTKNQLSTKFSYEPGGLVASVTKPSGAATSTFYTTNGLLKTKINPDNSHISYLYDLCGRIIQEEKNGITTTIFYNDAALEEIRSEGEFTEIYKFDAHGNVISFTDRAGYILRKTYDALNRLKTQISPNGDITTWSYQGDSIICTLPSGESTVQRYEAGAVAESQTFSPEGSLLAKICSNRDPQQSMSQEVMGDVIVTTWTNTLGLPIRIQQGNKITTHHYDACGNCIGTVDEEGHTTHCEFDSSGRLIQKMLPDGAVINYDYDADSNLIAYLMPGNLTWQSTYDTMGRKTSEWQEFDGKPFERWEYSYRDGHLIQTKDPQNRVHHYEYDTHGRLKKENIEKQAHEYTYDPRGLLTSATEWGNDVSKVERAYDESGRLIQESISLNGILLQNTFQTWTPSSRSLQIGDHKRDFHYQAGRLSQMTAQGLNLSYDYALSGSLIQKTTPFSTLEIHYNDSALPTTVNVQMANNTYHESLEWTPSGKLASHHSTYPKAHGDVYTYASRGYLKSTQEANYVFDFNEAGRGIRTSAPNLEALYNGLDEYGRIAKEQLDAVFFNTIYDSLGQVIVHNKDLLSWDSWGRIIAIKNDKYEWTASYDALGRRLQTIYTPLTNYLLFKSKGKPIVQTSFYDPEYEFLEIGVSYAGKTFWKLYGVTSCDAIVDSEGASLVLHHDIRNNLQAIITREDIIWNKDYPTPYGPRAPPALVNPDLLSFAQSLTWQSKQMDPTGLIWLGARYYDPLSGRFLSPDPISHPLCLDLYTYANGDPINNMDLDGRFSSALYKTERPKNITSLPLVTFNDAFEEEHAANNRSRIYDLSDLGRPELPNGLLLSYLNGIQNDFEYARKTAIYISDLSGGYNIHGVYGATMGFCRDVESYNRGRCHEDTGRVPVLHERWNAHLDRYPDGYILQFVHSRGAVDACNALLCYSEQRRKRIIIVAIAPGGYIYSETCAKVTHYRVSADRDLVPYRDLIGAEREKRTVIRLDSHKDAPLMDHTILSPTYRDYIKKECELFIKNKGI